MLIFIMIWTPVITIGSFVLGVMLARWDNKRRPQSPPPEVRNVTNNVTPIGLARDTQDPGELSG